MLFALLLGCNSTLITKIFNDDSECFVDFDDETISTSNASAYIDADCDGIAVVNDCDDNDDSSTYLSIDMDCDGILTIDDCNDYDPETINDMDCDGVLTANDCDDTNALRPNMDNDCDGVLTIDDCDDDDPNTINDMDCDGVLTIDDCDDTNPISLIIDVDPECDGFYIDLNGVTVFCPQVATHSSGISNIGIWTHYGNTIWSEIKIW